MSWAKLIGRQAQHALCPPWLEAARVRRARRLATPAHPLWQLAAKPPASRQLFLDLSVISRHDAGTGIQRVVRSLAQELLRDAPGWRVAAVAATRKQPYHGIAWPAGTQAPALDLASAGAGDVYLGLDFALDTIYQHQQQLAQLKRQGVAIWFVMYDLLPALRPDWFSGPLVVRYLAWLRCVASLADGFCCISPTVAAELRTQLEQRYRLPVAQMPAIHAIPMGWDVQHAPHSTGLGPQVQALLQRLQAPGCPPTALMVGTLEPRKGHADVLAAFERLWQAGRVCNLVIVGRPGWNTEPLQQSIRTHAWAQQRLFWVNQATDEEVECLYVACSGVIVASHGEGFGLPLLEALGYGKPVLARDIPVLRLTGGEGVEYFAPDACASTLAAAIDGWLEQAARAPNPNTRAALHLPTWGQAALQLTATLRGAC